MKIPFSEHTWETLSAIWRKSEDEKSNSLEEKDIQARYLLKVMFWCRRAFKAEEKQTYDLQKAWRNIEEQTRSRHRMGPVLWKCAAICILSLGIAWYFLGNQSGEIPSLAVGSGDTIRPGIGKAELILANGERILLNSQTGVREVQDLGIKLRNDAKSSSLHYEASSVADTGQLEFNIISIPKGGEYALFLPDGSQVWLNAGTTLRFPVQFAKGKRDVYLSGEAYFKVQKDTTAPFHVYTAHQDITVVGTTFNVSAYEDDKLWQTTLVQGCVRVMDEGRQVTMQASEQYFVDQVTGVRQLRKVDTDLYTSWIDGKFYFKAYTFEEIVRKLERWYDFTMIYQSEDIKKMCFTGTINKHHPIEEMLQYLEMTTNIRFSISGKNIVVSKN